MRHCLHWHSRQLRRFDWSINIFRRVDVSSKSIWGSAVWKISRKQWTTMRYRIFFTDVDFMFILNRLTYIHKNDINLKDLTPLYVNIEAYIGSCMFNTCSLVVCICVRHWFIEYHRKTACHISISGINCIHRHINLNIADSIMKGISIYALDLVMFDTLVCILVLRRIYRVPRQNGCSCFNSLERKLLSPLNQRPRQHKGYKIYKPVNTVCHSRRFYRMSNVTDQCLQGFSCWFAWMKLMILCGLARKPETQHMM